jgi:DNA invertase Pin-like site-specific DNA recombinase
MKAVGYARCSTREQATGGHSIAMQRAAIQDECRRRGWALVAIEQDVASGKSADNRPGLQRALAQLRDGHVDVLVIFRLDRLSRSLAFTAGLLEECSRERSRSVGKGRTRKRLPPWQLHCIDANGIDVSTLQGELMANILAAVARMQRRLIADNIREGLAHAKEHGTKSGKPIGRAPTLPDTVRDRIVRLRRRGASWPQIATALETDDVPTAQGGKWRASTVRKVFMTATAKPTRKERSKKSRN